MLQQHNKEMNDMKELRTFVLPVSITLTDLLNSLLNVRVIIVLAGLGAAVALIVGTAMFLYKTRKLTRSQKVSRFGLCLVGGAFIFSLLGFAGYGYFPSQKGIMLAAPKGPSTIVLASASKKAHSSIPF
jgi:hypothetical protein